MRLCELKDAWKLPIVVSRKVKFKTLKGKATFDKVRPGIVRIGFGSVETVDFNTRPTLLFITGTMHFRGKAKIGKGSNLSVAGDVIFGEKFHISAAGTVICRKKIEFGNEVLVSWDTLISDTDHHAVFDCQNDHQINPNKSVYIADHCWVGARAILLKGVSLGKNTVIGTGSVVTKPFTEENVCLGGNPAKIIRQDTYWKE